ncbi:Putative amidase domain protein [Bacillus sp. THAF10]|uniref:amidase domain-containing protein n=1 Tax=Bacillus sp. THAF10 TaxID=2587848 RepID=UPI0012694F85|nr:amidase domain-containing protein [Bacillus sp. THAF10]QFT90213.1 Putative amidase domain protein [Bacillus sp. THAF10]
MKKKILKILLCMGLIFTLVPFQPSINASTINENIMLVDLENLVKSHLEENQLNHHLSVETYTEYLMSLLIEDADPILANHPNYEQILYYAAEYIYELEKLQTAAITNPEVLDEIENFDLGDKLDSTLKEIKHEIAQEENQIEEDIKSFRETSIQPIKLMENVNNGGKIGIQDIGGSGWNGAAAASYAYDWYKKRNSQYDSHTLNCTNFVSQAIHAGGMSEKKLSPLPRHIYDTTSYWYSDRTHECVGSNSCRYHYHEATSWIRVVDFYSYWSKTKNVTISSTKSTIVSNSLVGDVVQLKRASDGRWFHSMIVNRKANGTIYLAGNTNDTYDKPLTDISAQSFRVIKFR